MLLLCYLASDGAALVVCDVPEKLLRMRLLLLVLPALLFQLLELQVFETLCFGLEHLTVLIRTQTSRQRNTLLMDNKHRSL